MPLAPPTREPTEGDVFGATGFSDPEGEDNATGLADVEVEQVDGGAALGVAEEQEPEPYEETAPVLRRIRSKPDLPDAARGLMDLQASMSPASRKVHEEYLVRSHRRR